MTRRSSGQATVELALVLPLIAFVALAIGQVALIGRARIMVTHAARAGARVAAVGGSDADVGREVAAAGRFDPARLEVTVHRIGASVEVKVDYLVPTVVPIVGPLIDNVTMVAVATMPLERPP